MAKNELIAHVSVCILKNQDDAARKQLLEDSKGIELTSTPPLGCLWLQDGAHLYQCESV